jgi:hypothetical protein
MSNDTHKPAPYAEPPRTQHAVNRRNMLLGA